MISNATFCEECRKYVTYNVIEKNLEAVLKGEKYLYNGKEALCNKCGSVVYVGEINDFNLKTLYDVYREKNKIISLDMIQKAPKKYNIEKRTLSVLLGWSEQTFSRYCDGYIPSKQNSDMLKEIYYNPEFYSDILEKNKNNLKSETI